MLNITEPNFGKRYNTIKAFERYLPYMTDAEALLLANGKSDWDEATVARCIKFYVRTKKISHFRKRLITITILFNLNNTTTILT